ncbi:MAG: hypothetical protein IK012_09950 [Fibrobacter sp.]|uniref:polysaccharide biosynthesis/export family protein n=1 Tax=Fibrobacter sp. TaxID=35828 RepID=UPI0025BC39F6|nr:polysaccharide biosynthesis/export family protein [Fibrobacter sp.]MBR4785554.1 hypothetical protein [Fibrobacter sp.]
MLRFLFLILAFSVSAALAGESSFSVGAPQFQTQEAKFQRASTVQEPINLEGAIDSSYVVGPGDFFEILIPKGIDVVQVSPEGSVSVPGCGIVKVDSLPLNQAKAAILGLLLTKYEEKFVQVQIVKMKKVHVSVLGAVNAPGFRAIDPQTRLSTMIGYVNGFKPLADKKNMKLIRNKDTLNIDFTKYEMEGIDSINIQLQNDDVIFVPYAKSNQTITIGTLKVSETVTHVEGRTFGEYLDNLKTFTAGDNRWAKVTTPDGKVETYEISKIRDRVFEPRTKIELWQKEPLVYVGGAVAAVGRALYNPDFHAIDYIGASGVTIITGSWSRVSVIRDGKSFSIDPYHDTIMPGDYIEIPRTVYEAVKDVTLFLASLLSVFSTAIVIYQFGNK